MRIITDSNNIVMYFGENLTLTPDYTVIEGNRDRRLTTANATIYTVPSLPRYFKGRSYTYTEAGGFVLVDSDSLTEVRRQKSPERALLDEVDIDTYVGTCSDSELRNIIKVLYKELRNAKR